MRSRGIFFASAIALVALAGCRADMADQPRYEPNSPSTFFPDGTSVRPLVPGVVARGSIGDDPALEKAEVNGQPVARMPVELDAALIARGQERYNIYCSPCHGRTGDGEGMIVQRGYRRPPSLHEERLRTSPDGYLYGVVTRGFGVMPAYQAQVQLMDRWAIVAYVRALQLSQHASIDDVPADRRDKLEQEGD